MNAEELARALGKPSRSGDGWKCLCPAHDDQTPSLSVADGDKGLVWRCHAGCEQDDVGAALRAKGLLANGDARGPYHHAALGEPSATWTYCNADGKVAFVVARYETPSGKQIRPWRPNGAGFEAKAIPAPRPLYRLPELLAEKSRPVLVVEGEKCADAATKILPGYAVTTWPGGADATKHANFTPLRDRDVIVWPDADAAGRKAAAEILARLAGVARKVAVLEVDDRPDGWDVADAVSDGWTADDLTTFVEEHARTVEQAPGVKTSSASRTPRLVGVAEFVSTFAAPEWVVDRILQRRYIYALTAFWGHGKTAIMLTVALYVAAGRDLGSHRVARHRVAFLCGENVDDVKLRVKLAAEALGIAWHELEGWIYFTEAPFPIDNPLALEAFVAENEKHGPFGLVIVDTGPAHSAADEENDNRQQHALATALRYFLSRFGDPCVVVLMHPAKGATKDSMQPRGGGAFSGGIDGELCAWIDTGSDLAELYHRTKFRGPGFKPFAFKLEKRELAEVRDNFGNPAVTVVAMLTDERPVPGPGKRRLSGAEKVALDALRRCIADGSEKAASVPPEVRRAGMMGQNTAALISTWRQACYAAQIADGDKEAQKKAFKRARIGLQAARLVAIHEGFAWIPGEPYHAEART